MGHLKRRAVALVIAATALPIAAGAQPAWPERSVQVLVPFPAGGVVDILGRAMATALSERLGASLVVVNRDGASGAIAARALAAARPDGATIGFFPAGPITTQPLLVRDAGYDLSAFRPICQVFSIPYVLAASPTGRFATLADALAAARAAPGRVSIGYGGDGTAAHFATVAIRREARLDLLAVPFRGDPPNATALRSGDVQLSVLTAGVASAGGLRLLAALTQARLPGVPDVPTATEAGLPVVEEAFGGIVAPRDLPQALADRLGAACAEAAEDPRVLDTLQTARLGTTRRDAAGFAAALEADRAAKDVLIRTPGFRTE